MARKKASPDSGPDESIRKRLTNTALYPSAVLFGIVLCILGVLGAPAIYSKIVATGVKQVSLPGVKALAAAQTERELSLTTLAQTQTHTGGGLAELVQQQQNTDQLVSTMRSAMAPMLGLAPQPVADKVAKLNSYLDGLPAIRGRVDSNAISPVEVNNFYNGLLVAATDLFETQARIAPDVKIPQRAIMGTELFRASDLQSQESSLVAASIVTNAVTPADYSKITSFVGAYHYLLDSAAPYLEPGTQSAYQQLLRSPEWQRLVADENNLIQHGPGNGTAPVNFADWQNDSKQVSERMTGLVLSQASEVADLAESDANIQLLWAALGTLVALAAAVASVYLARRVAGSLVDRTLLERLKQLRDEAAQLVDTRINDITTRLRRNEVVDIDREFPELDQGDDEIGQLARELNKSNQALVQAVASEATTRTGVTKVLQTIASQSQLLAHNVIDKIVNWREQEEDETRLARLYEIDALATQIRRRADGLVAVSGGKPSVRHRNPQPLADVLLGAAAETDQYRRVVIEDTPDVTLSAPAIEDTTHLLSHLIENALEFSNPNTRVYVTSTVVTNGVAIEIVDQGVGMDQAELDRANAMMSSEPQINVMALQDEPRLGFFVVAQLAARQGIRVTFEPSRYGGVRATALIPRRLIYGKAASEPNNHQFERENELQPVGGSVRVPEFVARGMSGGGQLRSQRTTLTGDLQLSGGQADPGNGRPPETRPPEPPVARHSTGDDARPPLPQRKPRQSIPSELLEPPPSISTVSEEQAQRRIDSLVDFARGTDEGRLDRDNF